MRLWYHCFNASCVHSVLTVPCCQPLLDGCALLQGIDKQQHHLSLHRQAADILLSSLAHTYEMQDEANLQQHGRRSKLHGSQSPQNVGQILRVHGVY